MRKVQILRYLSIAIIIIINLILQPVFFRNFDFRGIAPNVFIITIVSFGLLRGKIEGAVLGFCLGFMQDVLYGEVVGLYTIIYMNIGWYTGYMYRNFYRDSLLIPIGVIALADFVQNFIVYFFTFLFRGRLALGHYFIQIIIPEIIYTLFVGFLLYRLYYMINLMVERREWLKENED